MTETSTRPLSTSSLHTLTRSAVEATGSASGWLLLHRSSSFRVVAEVGGSGHGVGDRLVQGAAGMVFASGQAAALLPAGDDESNFGAAGFADVPGALLAVPCGSTAVIGVLELGRAESDNYMFDDLELAVLLGDIAGAMLEEQLPANAATAEPGALAEQLTDVARREPARYQDIVRTVGWMLQ